jgi:hypothetical protein
MLWKSLKDRGHIGVDSSKAIDSSKPIKSLLNSMVSGFVEESVHFYQHRDQRVYPFINSELSVAPFYYSGITRAGGACQYQFAVARKGEGTGTTADFWIHFKDTVIIAEAKHSQSVDVSKQLLYSATLKAWRGGAKQVSNITRATIKDEASVWQAPVWTVSMLSVGIVARKEQVERYSGREMEKPAADELLSVLRRQLSDTGGQRPNWTAMWTASGELNTPQDLSHSTGAEIFPAVAFFAWVKRRASG